MSMTNSLLISENHLFFTVENTMRQICDNMLSPVGIVYFNYLRYYNDGSCYLLSTHEKAIKDIFENNVPVAAPVSEKYIKNNFNYFLLPIGSYDKYLHRMKVNLNLEYFINLIDRYNNYFELFCFGSRSNHSEIVNFYINNMNFLEKFKFYFKDKAADLIRTGEQNKVILPEIMKPPYQGLENNSDHFFLRNHIKSRHGDVELTQRQYDCLAQLAAGRTAKEAARQLGISHRTVENYLANLKSILDCNRKSQLVDIYLLHFKQ